jgi:hypothetical protein
MRSNLPSKIPLMMYTYRAIVAVIQVTGNNRSTIIVPSSGLQQFRTLLDEFIE